MKARTGVQPRSIAASSSAAIDAAQARLHHHHDETHRQRRVRGRHRPEAARDAAGDEQQQQRQPGDDFRHHQRRVDHAGEQRAAAETPDRATAQPRRSVPSTVASVAETKATRRLIQAASIIA